MFRLGGLITVIALSFAATCRAQVMISVTSDGGVPTPGLPGFKTFTFSAHSNHLIHAIDAARDGANDPVTGYGFFGPMNQVNPSGLSTVFMDNNADFPSVGANLLQDSQFLVRTEDVVIPPGLAEEGPNILQGAWAWSGGLNSPIAFAQIVTNGTVCYRCVITASTLDVDAQILTGCVSIPEPSTLLALALATFIIAPSRRYSRRSYRTVLSSQFPMWGGRPRY